MTDRDHSSIRNPLSTPDELAREPTAFPVTTTATPEETCYDDWRTRLTGNLCRRGDGRWEPLTYVHPSAGPRSPS